MGKRTYWVVSTKVSSNNTLKEVEQWENFLSDNPYSFVSLTQNDHQLKSFNDIKKNDVIINAKRLKTEYPIFSFGVVKKEDVIKKSIISSAPENRNNEEAFGRELSPFIPKEICDSEHLNLEETSNAKNTRTIYELNSDDDRNKKIIQNIERILEGARKKPNEMENNIRTILEHTHNIVLTGSPGTGKTHMAREIAQQMCITDDMSDTEKMNAMKEQIGFVQFHPSYDYTDFVEGLRPISQFDSGEGEDSIGFVLKDGVFKDFCSRALGNLLDRTREPQELSEEKLCDQSISGLIDDSFNQEDEGKAAFLTVRQQSFTIKDATDEYIIIDIPANEKSNILSLRIDVLKNLSLAQDKIRQVSDIRDFLGHKSTAQIDSYYFSLMEKIKDRIERLKSKEKSSKATQICLKNYVFIIDEINRGDISKIFGELFFSIDPGYRVTVDQLKEVKNGKNPSFITTVRTQYANMQENPNPFDGAIGERHNFGHFFIPENVYIIGTMNDIDRSVESLDFAMRRRFIWLEITAEESAKQMNLSQESQDHMKRLNDAITIIPGLGSSYSIGGAYFLKETNEKEDANDVDYDDYLWEYRLKPLLREYLRGLSDPEGNLKKLHDAYYGSAVSQDEFVTN